ncbi:UDP-4-amino-4,6-dideoxy-N-acetyl-beta-L-altrosamine transaminase [Alphaproteobacteria bacterium LSUCC0719]
MIPYGRQQITKADIDSVVNVLKSDFLTQGPQVPEFERRVASYCGANYGVAANSATSALHLACMALGLGPGDWLWTSPITFVASANCALYCGAKVDFVDIDPATYNLCPKALEWKLQKAALEGRLPKVVMPVHLCGQPCEMQDIYALSQQYGFRIIEDASHAIGGRYQDAPIGSCQYSDITVFSFHPVKIITTAEGGLACTQDEQLADKMALLRSHGITRDPNKMDGGSQGPWYYQQIDLGFNYRMTELQAALGTSQLAWLDDYVEQRHRLAKRYDALLENLPVKTPWRRPDSYSAFHLYVVRLDVRNKSSDHRQVFECLREHQIGVNLHYIPVHSQPYYRAMGFCEGDFPEAELYYREAITLPLYPSLSESLQDEVVTVLAESLGK